MFIWGTDLAKCMATLTRVLVSGVGPASNKTFFTYLLLLSSSVKSLAICDSASLPLWPKASTHSLWADLPSSVVSQLFSSILFENGFCTDLKHFLFKTAGETEAQRVTSRDWLKAIPWKSTSPEPEPRPPDLASPTLPSTSHCLLLTSLGLATPQLLGPDPSSAQIQPNRIVLRWGSLHWLGRNHGSLRNETYKF